MNDIAKCNGNNCPIKDKCYRHIVEANTFQWYVEAAYYNGDCELYREARNG